MRRYHAWLGHCSALQGGKVVGYSPKTPMVGLTIPVYSPGEAKESLSDTVPGHKSHRGEEKSFTCCVSP